MEILEMKNTISEIKNSLNEYNSRIEMIEEKAHELEDRRKEMIQSEEHRENVLLFFKWAEHQQSVQ